MNIASLELYEIIDCVETVFVLLVPVINATLRVLLEV